MKTKVLKRVIKKNIPKQRIKVDLFLVGAQKSGTSSLHRFLTNHPSITGGFKKEINFFNHDEKYQKGYGWYHKQFESPLFFKSKKVYIDSTPQYLSDLSVAEKIYAYNPNAKIIILLREPVARAYSAWNMYKQFSQLSASDKDGLIRRHLAKSVAIKFRKFIDQSPFPDFQDYVNAELKGNIIKEFYPNILRKSIYHQQVAKYINIFIANNVLIFDSKSFSDNKLKVINQVVSQFNLSELNCNSDDFKNIHIRQYDSSIDKETENKLKGFYKPHNEKLFSLISQKFDW